MAKESKPINIPSLGEVLEKLRLSFVCGLGIIVVFSLQFLNTSLSKFISIVGVGFLIAVAVYFIGILIGFIFGIPRILSQESRPLAVNTTNDMTIQEESSQCNLYQENSNLDHISDWLTKILVGIGLIQLIQVPAALQQYSEFIKPALGDLSSSGIFGIAILIFFSVNGFLTGYLWTRRSAAVEFGKGMYALHNITNKLENVQNKLYEMDEQTCNDSEAFKLVRSVLHPVSSSPPINQEELREKIKKASHNTIAQIFYYAVDVRERNWRDQKNKYIIERTIPIFRALIANDTENKYYDNHGQLGFALVDKQQPDWAEAYNEFTRAIEIRGPWKPENGVLGLQYEFNRAICRIHLDEGFNNDKPAIPAIRELILKDISSADNDPYLSNFMMLAEETPISKWMSLNNLNINDYVHLR
jgi:hypothetical protein